MGQCWLLQHYVRNSSTPSELLLPAPRLLSIRTVGGDARCAVFSLSAMGGSAAAGGSTPRPRGRSFRTPPTAHASPEPGLPLWTVIGSPLKVPGRYGCSWFICFGSTDGLFEMQAPIATEGRVSRICPSYCALAAGGLHSTRSRQIIPSTRWYHRLLSRCICRAAP